MSNLHNLISINKGCGYELEVEGYTIRCREFQLCPKCRAKLDTPVVNSASEVKDGV